jgi:histone H3/H4
MGVLSMGSIVVEIRAKEFAKKADIITKVKFSGDALDALEAKVQGLILDALHRAKENGRVTVQAQDF